VYFMVLQRYLNEYGVDAADLTYGLAAGVGTAWKDDTVPVVFGTCTPWLYNTGFLDHAAERTGSKGLCGVPQPSYKCFQNSNSADCGVNYAADGSRSGPGSTTTVTYADDENFSVDKLFTLSATCAGATGSCTCKTGDGSTNDCGTVKPFFKLGLASDADGAGDFVDDDVKNYAEACRRCHPSGNTEWESGGECLIATTMADYTNRCPRRACTAQESLQTTGITIGVERFDVTTFCGYFPNSKWGFTSDTSDISMFKDPTVDLDPFPNYIMDHGTRLESLRKAQTSYLFSIIVVSGRTS